jgi:O-antigen ligase
VIGAPAIFFHQGDLLKGVFVHANTLGAFGAESLAVMVAASDRRFTRHRKLVLAGTGAMAICLIGSKSRAGLGGALISLLVYLLTTRKLRRMIVGAIMIAILALTAFTMLPFASDVATRESASFFYKGNDEDILTSRRDVWDTGWENIYASPVIGHGFGTSVGEETKEWRLVGLGGREKGNAFLAIIEETGGLGSIVMFLPILLCLLNGIGIRRLNLLVVDRGQEFVADAKLTASFWAGVIGGLVNNMAEATLWSPGMAFGGFLLFLAGAAEGLMIRTTERL